jgi:hypothetical protein
VIRFCVFLYFICNKFNKVALIIFNPINITPSAMKKIKFLILLLIILSGIDAVAQQDTTYIKPNFKNTVRFNLTNPLIFGNRSLILGYERQLKNNQSFSINIGQTSYPKLIFNDTDSMELSPKSSEKGFHISGDYRFYLQKENKYAAPRGVYIGPYFSYNYFNRINNWTLDGENFQGNVSTDMTINIFTAGFELGYQFVFWDRMTLDMILLGPGVASYSLDTKLNTTLDPDEENKFFEAINDYLSEKFPGYDNVIDAGEYKRSGTSKTTDLGYRYMIMIGYRF